MKELSIEEKAKLFDEAIKRAKIKRDEYLRLDGPESHVPQDIEFIFPALKESEDENIRKYLMLAINRLSDENLFFAVISKYKILAWLEKQGEHKVKPKFKVGDWIVTPDNEVKQIEKVTFGNYWFTDESLYNIIDVDNKGHLWTIQDAKDGDVLAWYDSKCIALFKEISDNDTFKSYGFVGACTGVFENGAFHDIEDAHPATREQRDLLLTKMKEIGYEWDVEDKVLNKIEQKPTWSEEDEMMLECVLDKIGNLGTGEMCKDWLKSIKDRFNV